MDNVAYPLWIIALFFAGWTTILALAMMIVAFKVMGTVKRLEKTVDDLKRDVMPIVYQGRGLADDFKKIGKDVRKQVEKSEYMVRDTLQNVTETTTRVKEAVTGLALILGTIGRILSLMGGGDKKKK